jgi:hypothetical protein
MLGDSIAGPHAELDQIAGDEIDDRSMLDHHALRMPSRA